MKVLLYLLLILVTGIYILPVKEFIHGDAVISMTEMDETKDENNKKEKQKELFSITASERLIHQLKAGRFCHFLSPVPVISHTVETPPPDLI